MLEHEKSKREEYMHEKRIKKIFEELLTELISKRPADPVACLIDFLENKNIAK